ncbi:MAG TPA: hypothetical protein VGE50_06345 [Gammaproteobacteria bacterium]
MQSIDLTTISMPMAALLASLIGATATITASLLNLRMAWKKELLARANHKPVTRKQSRGPVLPVLALLVASAVGGFALSYYLGSKGRAEAEAREAELRSKLDQLISLSTQQLANTNHNAVNEIAQQVRDEELRRHGAEGVTAMVVLDKCAAVAAEGGNTAAPCGEEAARPLRLCAEIPANTSVTALDLFARPEGDSHPWSESRVSAGADFGGGRFTSRSSERLLSDSSKQVCQELLHWGGEHSLTARIAVRYSYGQ